MSHKGSRHRVGNYPTYQNNLDEIRKNTPRTGKPCAKHGQFSPYCVECWKENQVVQHDLDKPTPDD